MWKNRYGPKVTKAIVASTFVALFVPIPGLAFFFMGVIVVAAEIYLSITGQRPAGNPPIFGEVILTHGATPEQLRAVGRALWKRITLEGNPHFHQLLNNQQVADLLQGQFPGGSPRACHGIHCQFSGRFKDVNLAIQALRPLLALEGVLEIVIAGQSIPRTTRVFNPDAPPLGTVPFAPRDSPGFNANNPESQPDIPEVTLVAQGPVPRRPDVVFLP